MEATTANATAESATMDPAYLAYLLSEARRLQTIRDALNILIMCFILSRRNGSMYPGGVPEPAEYAVSRQ